MFNVYQFRELIIKPALNDLVLYSPEAEELLVFTCAVESLGGSYLKQVKGPALGIYQMEPRTYNDIWQNFIMKHSSLMMKLHSSFNLVFIPPEDRLVYDLRFATAIARIHYERFKEKIPDAKDIEGIWEYYKKYYNTSEGAASKEFSILKYQDFVKD
jgi:hypothetical protein